MKRTYLAPMVGMALMLGVSNIASAAVSYSFNFASAASDSTFATLSNFACTGTGCNVTVTATAWWFDGSFAAGNTSLNASGSFTPTTTAAAASLGIYNGNGLGVCTPNDWGWAADGSCSSPGHQVDNYRGVEIIMLQFSSAVDISSITLGNYGGVCVGATSATCTTATADSDFSYWVNKTVTTGATYASLGSATTQSGVAGSNAVSINGVNTLLISAAVNNPDSNYDEFKLASIGGTVGANVSTPEPSTMLLIGSGLVGAALLRRRKQNNA